MTAIYQEVTLNWRGVTYQVTPTYRMIQAIEQQVSIAGVAGRIANAAPPISHIAFIIAHILQAGGCKDASPDSVYAAMASEMDADQFADFAMVVLSAFVPSNGAAGNADAVPTTATDDGAQTKT